MAIAFPVTICKGVSEIFNEGDLLELDFENSLVKNMTHDKKLSGAPLHPELLKIIKSGGILESLNCE
jgi:3-isopropylmalate/(R)-2-methylmalate dehydratase small subunit